MPRVASVFVCLCFAILSACAHDRGAAPIIPAAAGVGQQEMIFGATSRKAEGSGFGSERSATLSLLEMEISIPPERERGTLNLGGADPDPRTDFVISAQTLHDEGSFRRRIKSHLNKIPAYQREVTIFVHGFNNTHAEAAFRTAQLKRDIEIPGATIFYSWPSRGATLGYAYDEDSALFARDGLENLLRATHNATGLPVIIVAHSLGSQLTMEALRQIEISSPGWSKRNLSGVILMSPDLDVDLFKSQIARFQSVPQPFVIFANSRDRALGISQRIRGTNTRARLGNISSLEQLSDLPVQVVDTSNLKRSRDLNHFPAANSPTLIALLRRLRDQADAQERRRIELARLLPGDVSQLGGAVRVELDEEAVEQ
ncbi:alpha/beta fold hydrolase [Epibacterium ulvae]|uniref:alpha/beta hydrolase n=1 Tax=Epibacterium ulvae TaxID=1156985 RepID=UPI001BFC50EF|nr:alpha/beta fold hydrolase [Epibacterium ulvae]MBT8153611.1 alpha/beta fold hydrolase [Epibacterium ulvae]